MYTIAEARADGFELEERVCAGQWLWGWRRGDDERWPCHLTRDEAIGWMADRLNRVRVFAESDCAARTARPFEAVRAGRAVDRIEVNVGEPVQAVERKAARG
jgi:hypothetical protein